MSLVNLLFGYKGRISRTQYWLGAIGSFVAIFVLVFVFTLTTLLGSAGGGASPQAAGAGLMIVWGLLFALGGWINTALQWKRFHDRGRPGWIALLPLIPSAIIVAQMASAMSPGARVVSMTADVPIAMFVLWAISLYFFIELGCLAGKPGPNTYGNPPGGGAGVASQTPRAPAANAAQPATAMPSLFGAQSAMDRAIAEHQAKPAAASRPAPAAPAPAGASASFGRRPQRA